MTKICPKPCSRLATAATFIIIGVVQLLAGVILLRSKFADLLSGPDFMTGSSNITIGCIYGAISSIWKINKKKKSMKNTAMKNILAALLLSVMAVNATAAIILIMGDGNKLLNLHIVNSKQKTIDFASEILAYAYVASVCSPIICIVIALVITSGRCIEVCRENSTDKAKDSIANDNYNWVFDPKPNDNLKVISDSVETSSESASTSQDSVFAEEDGFYPRRKPILPIENIPSPLNMWRDKRERLLNDANWSREQLCLDSVLKKPDFCDSSYARLIPRIKESSLRRDFNPKLGDFEKKSSKTYKPILKRSSSSPVSRGMVFQASNRVKDPAHARCKQVHCKDENEENRFSKQLKTRKGLSSGTKKATKFMKSSEKTLNRAGNEDIHFVDPVISELKAETLRELKQKVAKILPGGTIAVIKLPDSCQQGTYRFSSENSDVPQGGRANAIQEPHCSDDSRYKLFINCSETSNSSGKQLLSDKTPESTHNPTYWTESSPCTEGAYKNKSVKTTFGGISKIRSRSFDSLNEESPLQNNDDFLPLNSADEKKDNLDSPRASLSKQQIRRFDTARKMSMASIAEIPSEEDYYSEINSVCSASEFEDKSQMTDENSNRVKMAPTSRHTRLMKASKRKSSLTSNKLLKRMWSSSEPKINVSDMIVDQDSLIGLSEEELLARTFRLRSLRKTVENRLKMKRETEKQVARNTYSSVL